MTTNPKRALVRDVMHAGCSCVPHEATMIEAAKQMSEEGVGALPICGPDERLIGMLTDRDIVVHCLATDRDPTVCTAGELASGRIIWVTETTSISGAIEKMEEHLIRRIPVVDEDYQLCGMLSQADIATHLGRVETGELVELISRAEPRQSVAF